MKVWPFGILLYARNKKPKPEASGVWPRWRPVSSCKWGNRKNSFQFLTTWLPRNPRFGSGDPASIDFGQVLYREKETSPRKPREKTTSHIDWGLLSSSVLAVAYFSKKNHARTSKENRRYIVTHPGGHVLRVVLNRMLSFFLGKVICHFFVIKKVSLFL